MRQVGEAVRGKCVIARSGVHVDGALENVEKALCGRGGEGAAGGKLGSHLRESSAKLRADVDDVGRLQQVVRLEAASCRAEMMHANLVGRVVRRGSIVA